jgi:release factor glutamine methyltransferase
MAEVPAAPAIGAASTVLTPRHALAQCGLAPVDANALLAFVTGRNRAFFVAHPDDPLPQQQVVEFLSLARRRRDGEPVAYLTGHREFHGLDLAVTPDVLIPRPETETLFDAVLAHIAADASARVLDLGTGSGAIALAIAQARPRADVLGVDDSEAALAVARGNATRLAIGNARFERSDWYGALGGARFDVAVANPPYIAEHDPHLAEGDLRHEPRQALTPGGDGLGALRVIVDGARAHLVPGGVLAVEHGFDQSDAVQALFAAAGAIDVRRRRDLAGHWRVAEGRWR